MNIITLSVRFYRMLLKLYPTHFRAEYGDEMLVVFRDSCRERYQTSSAWGVIRLWLPLLADLVANAAAERIAGKSRRRIMGETILALVGLVANCAAWVWLVWTVAVVVVLMLNPWDVGLPPAGTLAQKIADFFDESDFWVSTVPGSITAFLSLLVFINALTRYRKFNVLSLIWRFAVSTFLLGVASLVVMGGLLLILRLVFPNVNTFEGDQRNGVAAVYIGLAWVGLLLISPLKLQAPLFYTNRESPAKQVELKQSI